MESLLRINRRNPRKQIFLVVALRSTSQDCCPYCPFQVRSSVYHDLMAGGHAVNWLGNFGISLIEKSLLCQGFPKIVVSSDHPKAVQSRYEGY